LFASYSQPQKDPSNGLFLGTETGAAASAIAGLFMPATPAILGAACIVQTFAEIAVLWPRRQS
jgi:hypothetical protein